MAHWRVENGELVNDGQRSLRHDRRGVRRHRVPHRLQDRGQGRQRHLPARHAAGADLGLRTEAKAASDRPAADKGSGGLWNNTPGCARQGPAGAGRQALRRVEPVPHPARSASRTTVCLNDKLVVDNAIMENYWDRTNAAAAARPDPAADPRRRDPLAQRLPARDPGRRSQRLLRGDDKAQGFAADLQRQGPDRLDRRRGQLRSPRRRDRLQAGQGRRDLHREGVRRLRRAARIQAAARRQQRPGHPLSGQGTTRPTTACASCRCSTTRPRSTPSSTRASTTAPPTAWSPAHRGYLRPVGQWNYQEVTVNGSTDQGRTERHGHPRRGPQSRSPSSWTTARIPARTVKRGHFGFAGHSDPVMFRNIAIKTLDGD